MEEGEVEEGEVEGEGEAERLTVLERGRKEMGAGRYDKAIAILGKAKQAGEDGGEADRLVKECYRRIRKRKVRRLVGKGNRAYGEKRWAECVKHFAAARKLGGLTAELEQKLKKCSAMAVF